MTNFLVDKGWRIFRANTVWSASHWILSGVQEYCWLEVAYISVLEQWLCEAMCLSCNSLPVAMILQSSSNKVILFTDNQSDCTVFLSEAVSSSPTVIATSEGYLSLSVCVAFAGPALSGQGEGVNNFFTLPMNFFSPANFNILGTSKPPCGRSNDAHLLSVTSHTILPPRWINREQTADIVLGMWSRTVPASFFAAIT